jgi:hypothetical protein
MLPVFGRPLKAKIRHAVIGTRLGHNKNTEESRTHLLSFVLLGGWVNPLSGGDEDVTVFVTRSHCVTYPMPRMVTIRLKLLKVGALVHISVRRVLLQLSSAYP